MRPVIARCCAPGDEPAEHSIAHKLHSTAPIQLVATLLDGNMPVLPSNLRHTTRECVYFWLRDRDSSHIIRSAMAENPTTMTYANFTAVTLTLTQWPSYTNLTRIVWRCTRRLRRKSRLSQLIVIHTQTDRHTDRRRRNYFHATLRVLTKSHISTPTHACRGMSC